jgi:uncharacterized DUF497 family protein
VARFEWDDAKAAANFRKHGVRFVEAITAFDDPFALVAFDDEHSHAEAREILIGRATRDVLVVVFAVHVDDEVRISALARRHEPRG